MGAGRVGQSNDVLLMAAFVFFSAAAIHSLQGRP
jgi:hypothetical protein